MIRRLASAPVAVAMMAAPVVFFGLAAWSRRWMSDDGYIYLRVVRQLVDGNGPVFNRGERVEATTSPLWLGLLSAGKEVVRPVSLPWIAVVLGLALSIAGLVLATWGAYRLCARRERGMLLPVGAIVVAALPPFWDFATSGLETGLSFAWLGACFFSLSLLIPPPLDTAAVTPLPQRGRGARGEGAMLSPLPLVGRGAGGEGVEPRASSFELPARTFLPVLLGLGPLVRPDFALYSIAFLAALLLMRPQLAWSARIGAIALAVALPLAYEVFRMGYYAALVPNPAFAKEASTPNLARGWRYLVDAVHPYWLFVPFVLLAAASLPSWVAKRTPRAQRILIAATIAAAAAHGAYAAYAGGDFMHARLLLPAVFALLMPFAVVEIDSVRALVLALGVIAWAIVCAALLRPPYNNIGPHGIANERAYYVALAYNAHPVTLRDYGQYEGEALALIDRHDLSRGHLLLESREEVPVRPGTAGYAVVDSSSIGIYSYVFDDDVHVVDLYGLADPIAGRLELAVRGRPGHEKLLPESWVVARFADPSVPVPNGMRATDIAAARDALSCGARRLLAAVSAPLTPGRFARNLIDAFRLHRLRIPPDAIEAKQRLC